VDLRELEVLDVEELLRVSSTALSVAGRKLDAGDGRDRREAVRCRALAAEVRSLREPRVTVASLPTLIGLDVP